MSKLIKSYKNDLAPFGFYFDIFALDLFKIPIMPVPMRIDKILRGDSTFFIIPDIESLSKLSKQLHYSINFESFFLIGFRNLLEYAKKQHYHLSFRTLKESKLRDWFEQSKNFKFKIPILSENFTFALSEFIKTYSIIEKNDLKLNDDEYIKELVKYCDVIIDYFKEIIEKNVFQVIENNSPINKQLYLVKKEKYYPNIIKFEVEDLTLNRVRKWNFVPYLIYDDILDCFSYNRKLLVDKTQLPCDIKIWSENHVICKLKESEKSLLKEFKLQDINFEAINK